MIYVSTFKIFESFSFLSLRNCCFSALSFRPSLLAFENGIYIAEWWFISVKSWPLSRLPRGGAENLSQARPPYHRGQCSGAFCHCRQCTLIQKIQVRPQSSWSYLRRRPWFLSCAHKVRLMTCEIFVLSAIMQCNVMPGLRYLFETM